MPRRLGCSSPNRRRPINRNAHTGLAVIGLGTLVVPLDSMVNVAFPDIVRDFALPIPMIQWVVICYVLTHASLMLVFGRLGDMFGHRRIFLIGAATSALAFAACALAPAYGWLLAARVAQGIGAALLLSCGTALATFLFPETQRARALGLYTMIFGIGGAIGPPLAGLLVELWGWRAVYAIRAPLCLLAFALAWRLPTAPQGGSRETFDAPGAIWLTLAITATLLAINQSRDWAEHSWLILALASIALLATAAFIRQERRVARPIIDVGLFRDPGFAVINLCNVLVNLAAFAVMLLAPFYLNQVVGLSVVALGLVLACSPLGMTLSAPLAGWAAARMAPRRLLVAGAAMVAVSLALVGQTAGLASIGLAAMLPALVLQGVGLGLYQVAYADIVTRTLPRRARGVAGSLAMMTRTLGTVGGAAVLMLTFQTARSLAEQTGLDANDALVAGFRAAFLLAAAITAAAAMLLLWRAPR